MILKKKKNKNNTEFLMVWLSVLFVDLIINYVISPSLLSGETILIKVLTAFVVASLFPQIKYLFQMKIEAEYVIFIIMGTAVASAFIGNFLTDSIRFLTNYPRVSPLEKNQIIAQCIEYGAFLLAILALLIRSVIFMLKNKVSKKDNRNR